METDPILSVVNSKKERMNSVFRVYSDLIYQIQIKMKKLENLKNQRIGFAKVLEQGLSLEEQKQVLEGRVLFASKDAEKAADYTSILAHMLKRDRRNREAKQVPYEDMEREFMAIQLQSIADHQQSDQDHFTALVKEIKSAKKSL